MSSINTQTGRQQYIRWNGLGFVATASSVVAVLVVQVLTLSVWPHLALFKPLESLARSAIFTLIPAVGATALFAWLVAHRPNPVKTFVGISVAVLVISIVPDYLIPVPDKSFLASTVTALLHVVAAIVIAAVLVVGYQWQQGKSALVLPSKAIASSGADHEI